MIPKFSLRQGAGELSNALVSGVNYPNESQNRISHPRNLHVKASSILFFFFLINPVFLTAPLTSWMFSFHAFSFFQDA